MTSKKVFTVSMDEELAKAIKSLVNSSGKFRSNSHLVEEAIKNYLEELK